jgi:hypothetical protein
MSKKVLTDEDREKMEEIFSKVDWEGGWGAVIVGGWVDMDAVPEPFRDLWLSVVTAYMVYDSRLTEFLNKLRNYGLDY